jgi:rhamnosyltransferase
MSRRDERIEYSAAGSVEREVGEVLSRRFGLAPSVSLVVPTLNAGAAWADQARQYCARGLAPSQILVIDSSSTDGTAETAASLGFRVKRISRQDFDHGGTRQAALGWLPDADVIVFVTQDVVFENIGAVETLVSCFDNQRVGIAYGRQMPHRDASHIAAHARLFNYPATSRVVSREDIPKLGFKAAFASNSFAAYRRQALDDVKGFPVRCIMGEDTQVAARMLLAGWKIAYCAEAAVRHSHNYGLKEEFKRYFDIGVFHAKERWMHDFLGEPDGEGLNFLRSEIVYLLSRAPHLLPLAVAHTCAKYFGYKVGVRERSLPTWIKRRWSMNSGYWRDSSKQQRSELA